MDFFTAARFAKQLGIHIRRAAWVEDVETPVAGSSNKRVTAWLVYWRGAWIYRPTGGADRVTLATDVTSADLRANDWTVMDAEGNGQIPPGGGGGTTPPPTPPILPPGSVTDGGSGSGGGGSGSGGGSGGSGSGSGSGGVTDSSLQGGGGGGGGGSGGGRSKTKTTPHPERSAPALTLTCVRSASGCVDPVDTGDRTDTFTWEVALASDDDARPGEVWLVTVWHGSPGGRKTVLVGTLAPGDSQSGMFSITAKPGKHFGVFAQAFLAGVGLQNNASAQAKMLGFCDEVPAINTFQLDGGSTGFAFSVPSSGSNYNLAVILEEAVPGVSYQWFDSLAPGLVIGTGASINIGGTGPFNGTFICRAYNGLDEDLKSVEITIAAP